MDDIKFRGKRKDTGSWEYEYYFKMDNSSKGNPTFIIPTFASDFYGKEVFPKTVGRYRGVFDDSDDENEICEGDIVKFVYNQEVIICKVAYEAGGFILGSNQFVDSYISFHDIFESDGEHWWIPKSIVIGNVTDTPILL
jgi:hypothetical protein